MQSFERGSIVSCELPPPRHSTFVIEDTSKGEHVESVVRSRSHERLVRLKATMRSSHSLQRDKDFLQLLAATERILIYPHTQI